MKVRTWLCLSLCSAAVFFGPDSSAGEKKQLSSIELELQTIVAELSSQPDQYENLQRMLMKAGQDGRTYDEGKNIWIST